MLDPVVSKDRVTLLPTTVNTRTGTSKGVSHAIRKNLFDKKIHRGYIPIVNEISTIYATNALKNNNVIKDVISNQREIRKLINQTFAKDISRSAFKEESDGELAIANSMKSKNAVPEVIAQRQFKVFINTLQSIMLSAIQNNKFIADGLLQSNLQGTSSEVTDKTSTNQSPREILNTHAMEIPSQWIVASVDPKHGFSIWKPNWKSTWRLAEPHLES